jgi:hypothetical protein
VGFLALLLAHTPYLQTLHAIDRPDDALSIATSSRPLNVDCAALLATFRHDDDALGAPDLFDGPATPHLR